MARPRSFNEQEVLQCAMMTFWRLGFDATTYKVLEKSTGVGVRSMHNTFGEKDDLFVKSLEMYHQMARGIIDQVFAEPGVAAIQGLFQMMVMAKEPDDITNSGCLMVNSVFEIAEKPDAVTTRIDAYRDMWRETFVASLTASGVEKSAERAEFLVGSLWGILSHIRLTGKTEAAAPMAAVVVETVEGWQTR